MADVSEVLRTQQLLGNVLRGDADAREFENTHRSSLELPIRGEQRRHAEES